MLLHMKLVPPKAVTPLPREGRVEATNLTVGVIPVLVACPPQAQVLKKSIKGEIGSMLGRKSKSYSQRRHRRIETQARKS